MIPRRFVREARATLEELAIAGALEGGAPRSAALRRLAAEARGLGLLDLGARLSALAGALDRQAGTELAEALLGAHDRVEALAAELARAELARAFGAEEELP
ncbi:hypothetical protein [Polyangium aurulentum]|uniref:hypothetical protein n=1 Tax=Polyangium aurulentum TaxID=2567896 RepID=UPI0010AE5B32|nr:hypothetical protein [Polyangium aurulentum]UQA59094.1 hypothetical protein E8A73_000835 [Polyangium aurulentum]